MCPIKLETKNCMMLLAGQFCSYINFHDQQKINLETLTIRIPSIIQIYDYELYSIS